MNVDLSVGISRVAIIDDHVALIEMLAAFIEGIPGCKVVGTATEAVKGLDLCREAKPDIIILDIVMPRISGLSLLGDIKAISPNSRVLIFAGSVNAASVSGAMAAGVAGFLEKTCTLDEFRSALGAVRSGRVYFDSQVSEIIRNVVSRNPAVQVAGSKLTTSEEAVLGFVANGLNSKEIATLMTVSVHTINNHRSNLMQKLGIHRVAQLTLHAARMGLVGEVAESPNPPGVAR
jgi:DNA-binding NarL/FixJ family response regulator